MADVLYNFFNNIFNNPSNKYTFAIILYTENGDYQRNKRSV